MVRLGSDEKPAQHRAAPVNHKEVRMVDSNVKVLGVYRVPFTDSLLERTMNLKYGGIELSFLDRRRAKKHTKEELSSVVLIEVMVTNADENLDMADFGQPNSDQAAYDEAYLSLDGEQVQSRFNKPDDDTIRLTFFLHYYDPQQPLTTSYGKVSCPPIGDMPKRLKEMVPYEPVG
jgi:hypothetical protein